MEPLTSFEAFLCVTSHRIHFLNLFEGKQKYIAVILSSFIKHIDNVNETIKSQNNYRVLNLVWRCLTFFWKIDNYLNYLATVWTCMLLLFFQSSMLTNLNKLSLHHNQCMIDSFKHPEVNCVTSCRSPLLFICLQLRTSPSGCTQRKERRWARWGLWMLSLMSFCTDKTCKTLANKRSV